ncbi:hypothetical protein BDY21DRAFT_335000 [Lineolata rhizophorae]|uniref:Uncharacterized protein n=1 Tax=Lineolata rhizophorae TaxID=578093 RepID=A0A6A6P8G5_9PEZI|nr:hypothetical protein BDY21DRAFT_335000 [Lineolata rhizophorae]
MGPQGPRLPHTALREESFPPKKKSAFASDYARRQTGICQREKAPSYPGQGQSAARPRPDKF